MRHPIDPKIDCVFKALLGSEENRNLLIHFLNAILGPDLQDPVTQVQILNPYNERQFLTDKLSIVDIKAHDDRARRFQIEIQLLTYAALLGRVLYTWNDLYNHQLGSGEDYGKLKPAYSIWILGEDLLPGDTYYTHRYRLRDERGQCLLNHGGIYLLELNKFADEQVTTEEQRWLKFFKEGEHLDVDRLPVWMQTPEMRQAMNTLTAFSEKERAYDVYQARQDFLRQQRAIERERRSTQQAFEEQKAALAEKDAVLAEKDAVLAEKDAALAQERAARELERQAKEAAWQDEKAALAEVERLKALMKGVNPPAGS